MQLTTEHTEITEINKVSGRIINSAIKIHSALGPGLLESVYEKCLEYELVKQGLKVDRQKSLPVRYEKVIVECGFRVDLLVENRVIVELKSVKKIEPIHEAQLLSYLKLSRCRLGLLINFNVLMLKNGIKRLLINI